MEKRCQQCRRKVDAELFICPHCEAILGDPIYKSVKPSKKRSGKKVGRKWLRIILMILSVLIAGCLFMYLYPAISDFIDELNAVNMGEPTLLEYRVTVYDDSGHLVSGAQIAFGTSDGDERIVDTNQKGYASCFVAETGDNLYARLVTLPEGYTAKCFDKKYFSDEGTNRMTFHVMAVDVIEIFEKYVVRVMDDTGNPVYGATVAFIMPDNEEIHIPTDQQGVALLEGTPGIKLYVRLVSIPDMYVWEDFGTTLYSIYSTTGVTIKLQTAKDLEPQYYEVKVVDEHGEPIHGVMICFGSEGSGRLRVTQTDLNGTVGLQMKTPNAVFIRIESLPEGYQENNQSIICQNVFFAPDEYTLTIQLISDDMDTENVYTVKVVTHAGEPVAGVPVLCQTGVESTPKCVGETGVNGKLSFAVDFSYDELFVSLGYVPEGYISNSNLYDLTFNNELIIALHDLESAATVPGVEIYTVRIVDQYGMPVPWARLRFAIGKDELISYGTTNLQGNCTVMLTQQEDRYVQIEEIISDGIYSGYQDINYYFVDGSTELVIEVSRLLEVDPV